MLNYGVTAACTEHFLLVQLDAEKAISSNLLRVAVEMSL